MMDLFEAIERGREDDVSRLLDADPNSLEEEVSTKGRECWYRPMAWAALHGRVGVVRLLVQRGAKIQAIGERNRTALYWAVIKGHEEMVTFLLSQGANVDITDCWGMTHLMAAAYHDHVGVVKIIVQHMGGDGLDQTDYEGRTALHHASGRGHEEVVAFLLSTGARGDVTDHSGMAPIIQAARSGHVGVVTMLLQHGRGAWAHTLHKRDRQGRTALVYALEGGHEEVVVFLLSEGAQVEITDQEGMTTLMWAARSGHLGVVKMLLQHMGGQGLDHTDNQGRTTLHYASEYGHEEIVAFLLSQGAQVDTTDGMRPFMAAASSGHLGVVKMILQHMGGQGLDQTDSDGRTALLNASEKGHEAMVVFLLSQGAQVDITGGMTLLVRGAAAGHVGVVKKLLQHVGEKGLDETDNEGRTALYWAVIKGHEAMVVFLLSQGARVDVTDRQGMTPLMEAVCRAPLGLMQILLKHMGGQGLDHRDIYEWTAMFWASDKGREGMLRALLFAGADTTITDHKGRTARAVADEMRHEGCVKVFKWWEGELERRSFLHRARCLHDISTTHQATPTAPLPAYLQHRTAAGQALPQVEVVSTQQQEQQAGASGKDKAASEAGSTEDEEEKHAVLAYVVGQLNEQLFTELMQGFRGTEEHAW